MSSIDYFVSLHRDLDLKVKYNKGYHTDHEAIKKVCDDLGIEYKHWRKAHMDHNELKYVLPLSYDEISQLAEFGMTTAQIGHFLGLGANEYNIAREMDPIIDKAIATGQARGVAKVAKTAYEQATKGENFDATKFYLRSKAGWTDKPSLIDNSVTVNSTTNVTITNKVQAIMGVQKLIAAGIPQEEWPEAYLRFHKTGKLDVD